jgi:hypothetical protein
MVSLALAACGGGSSSKIDGGNNVDAAGTADSAPSIDATPPVAITGTITNSNGAGGPIAGATVEIVGATPANMTTTAADGSYTLMAQPQQIVEIRASMTSFLSVQTGYIVQPTGSTVDLKLVPSSDVMAAAAMLMMTFDPGKGFVQVEFAGGTGGNGASLTAPHDNSFFCNGSGCMMTNVSATGSSSQLIFPNVMTGTTMVTTTPAAGHSCTSLIATPNIEVDANVLTVVFFICT